VGGVFPAAMQNACHASAVEGFNNVYRYYNTNTTISLIRVIEAIIKACGGLIFRAEPTRGHNSISFFFKVCQDGGLFSTISVISEMALKTARLSVLA